MAKTKFCAGISDISDSYMGFIIDQWGVLHDGKKPFSGVIDCLKELRHRKKRIILLSNSSNRADHYKADLKKMGIGPSLYDHIVTSGERIWVGLEGQDFGVFTNIGKTCYLIGDESQMEMIEGCGVEVVSDITKAEFIMIGESIPGSKTHMDYQDIVREGIKRRLKALCAVPDSRALMHANYLIGPGLIARRYEDSGGIVHYIGKPYRPVYRYCASLLQKHDIYPAQTIMIGDTMGHDMIGGFASGLDTCLTKSGLHAPNFIHCETPREVNRSLKVLMSQYNNVMPTYLIDEFKWGTALPDRKHKRRKQPAG